MKNLSLICCFVVSSGMLRADPALTIYNQNFAVVRETVPLDLKPGLNDVIFQDISPQLEPASVTLRDPAGKVKLQIVEQNFRNDPITQQRMLDLFVGKTIDFVIHEPTKPDRVVSGKVIRSGYLPANSGGQPAAGLEQPIIDVDGKVQFELPGLPVFPALSDDSILKPQLSWKLNASEAANLKAELGYVTGGLSWQADYNIVAPETGSKVDIGGWITMDNHSGKTFANAQVKLMAGDVNKIQDANFMRKTLNFAMADMAAAPAPAVTEKAFSEYHLYSIGRATTLQDQETKQVEFITATGVTADKFYVYDGAVVNWDQYGGYGNYENVRQNDQFGTGSNTKVNVVREFKNSQDNQLGIPLPKGRMRIYQRDDDGQLEFIGEDAIDHTPKDETIRLNVGNAFDITGARKRTNFHVSSANDSADESFDITVHNHKAETVEVRVREHLYRWTNWEIRANSMPFAKQDAQMIEFRVPLKPDEEKHVTYTVHYSW